MCGGFWSTRKCVDVWMMRWGDSLEVVGCDVGAGSGERGWWWERVRWVCWHGNCDISVMLLIFTAGGT